jgi:large subunit ribosomal protein L24
MATKLKQFNPRHAFKSKLRKGDEVVILAGKSRGETGTIETIDKKTSRVFIAGKNLNKKHQKPDLQNHEGGIVDVPMGIHISKVALADGKTKKPTRIGYKIEGGKKSRYAKKSNTLIDK